MSNDPQPAPPAPPPAPAPQGPVTHIEWAKIGPLLGVLTLTGSLITGIVTTTSKMTEYRDKLDRTAEKIDDLTRRVSELDNRIHEVSMLRAELRQSQETMTAALARQGSSPASATSEDEVSTPHWHRYWDPQLRRYMMTREIPANPEAAATSIAPPEDGPTSGP